MKRYLEQHIIADLKKKMVILTGPRQVGKTYLSKQIMKSFKKPVYLNFDDINDAMIIKKRQWPLTADLIVLDEIHKMKNWKNFLKGSFDTRYGTQSFLVTGSARLEMFRQTGDSLAGRYFHYRLNPLSLKEISSKKLDKNFVLDALLERGGFPEPFLAENLTDVSRWRNQYYTDLIREDVLDFSRIHELNSLKMLLEMLRSRVGSPLSYRSLGEDLQISPNTVQKYVDILHSLYIVFLIRPFNKNIARAIKREPKLYFYDTGFIKGDAGVKFENLMAVSLLKEVQYQHDSLGENRQLQYLRTKEGKEIDFIITKNQEMILALEAKTSDTSLSKNIQYFRKHYPQLQYLQIVCNLKQEKQINDVPIIPGAQWLSSLKA